MQVVEARRVAVDGGIVVARHRDRRGEILGEDAAERPAQGHALDAGDRRHALDDHPLGGIDVEQAAAEGKAIVGELRHQFVVLSAAKDLAERPAILVPAAR